MNPFLEKYHNAGATRQNSKVKALRSSFGLNEDASFLVPAMHINSNTVKHMFSVECDYRSAQQNLCAACHQQQGGTAAL